MEGIGEAMVNIQMPACMPLLQVARDQDGVFLFSRHSMLDIGRKTDVAVQMWLTEAYMEALRSDTVDQPLFKTIRFKNKP